MDYKIKNKIDLLIRYLKENLTDEENIKLDCYKIFIKDLENLIGCQEKENYNEKTRLKINDFIKELTSHYSNLKLYVDYNKEEDMYDIWHTNKELQFTDKIFISFVGKLLGQIFFDSGIYNISFGYDYKKHNALLNNIPLTRI